MKIIVGLGNIGDKYLLTRHNIGFLFLDFLRQKYAFEEFSEKSKLKALISIGQINEEKIVLVKPTTFMNLSGETVVNLKNFYKEAEWSDFRICYDDIDLKFGTIRLRESGSAGTHNGMRSIIQLTGTENIPRLRFGVDIEDRKAELASFVLSRFSEEELTNLSGIFDEALKKHEF